MKAFVLSVVLLLLPLPGNAEEELSGRSKDNRIGKEHIYRAYPSDLFERKHLRLFELESIGWSDKGDFAYRLRWFHGKKSAQWNVYVEQANPEEVAWNRCCKPEKNSRLKVLKKYGINPSPSKVRTGRIPFRLGTARVAIECSYKEADFMMRLESFSVYKPVCIIDAGISQDICSATRTIGYFLGPKKDFAAVVIYFTGFKPYPKDPPKVAVLVVSLKDGWKQVVHERTPDERLLYRLAYGESKLERYIDRKRGLLAVNVWDCYSDVCNGHTSEAFYLCGDGIQSASIMKEMRKTIEGPQGQIFGTYCEKHAGIYIHCGVGSMEGAPEHRLVFRKSGEGYILKTIWRVEPGSKGPPSFDRFVSQWEKLGCPDSSASYKVSNVRKNDVLSVRSGPGTKHPVVGKLPPDADCLEYLGEDRSVPNNYWWKVRNPDGTTGWVNSSFLAKSSKTCK